MEHFRTLLFCLAGCLVTVFGYPNGQISASCDSMLPSHENSGPQSSVSPYIITVSNTAFLPGNVITVTIKSNSSSNSFKGFLLEARLVGGKGIVGTFRPSDSGIAQPLTCGSQASAAISHKNSNLKQSVTAMWTAPKGSGSVRFRATVLSDFSTFWTGVESGIIETLQISNTTCGSQKFCTSEPTDCSPDANNCIFMSAAASNAGYMFEMSVLTPGYVAIGFSDDRQMGNDDVYICTKNSAGSILLQRAYTTQKVTPTLRNSSTARLMVSSYKDGVLKCSFITEDAISLLQQSSENPTYYIFMATGPSRADGQIQFHEFTMILASKVNLSSFIPTVAPSGESTEVLDQSGESTVVLGHGALMLVAWMTTGTIGMMTARYMKSAAAKPSLRKATWFQVHFVLMILTVILTIIAFIMVFADVRDWSGGAHPVLGCIVMILSFFQPIAAFFRPDSKHERRFIFNWGHVINAFVIKILAVAAIFLGLILVDSSPNQWLPKVMGGFFAWEVLFYIILEINMRQKTNDKYENVNRKMPIKIVALRIFIVGNLAFLIALLVGIGQSA